MDMFNDVMVIVFTVLIGLLPFAFAYGVYLIFRDDLCKLRLPKTETKVSHSLDKGVTILEERNE